jgi:hypothetical protein
MSFLLVFPPYRQYHNFKTARHVTKEHNNRILDLFTEYNLMRNTFIFLISLLLLSCGSTKPIARVALNEVRFITSPYISYQDGSYFLNYQVDLRDDRLRLVIDSRVSDDKGYYFFIGRTSFPEYDLLVSRPIPPGSEMEKFARQDAIFWMNPDKTLVKLQVKQE